MILSLVNFSTGLAMALLKPRDRLAQLGFATLGLAAVRNLASPLSAHPGTPPDMEFVLNQLAGFTFPAERRTGLASRCWPACTAPHWERCHSVFS